MKKCICYLSLMFLFSYSLSFGQSIVGSGKNLIQEKSFLLDSITKIAHKVSYHDELGNLMQTQIWDIESDRIWVSDYLYDSFGRLALNTFAAPKAEKDFEFENDFFLNYENNKYDRSDFENDLNILSAVSERYNSLGWYYSKSNNINPYQDVTEYPFNRKIFSRLRTGRILKQIGGNKIKGQWRSPYRFSMQASQELSQVAAFGKDKYSKKIILKTVTRNIDSVETVSFFDAKGNILAKAYSGGDKIRRMKVKIGEQGYVDIHVPFGNNAFGFSIQNSSNLRVSVFDLITEEIVNKDTEILGSGFYRIAVVNLENYDPINSPITVTYKENYYNYILNEYDEAGRLIRTFQPLNKLESTFDYNSLGQLIHASSPDEGEAWFKYQEDGQIRYSQNSVQKKNGKISYTEYDKKGRPKESGVIANSTVFTNLDPDAALISGARSEVTETLYDIADPEFEKVLAQANRSGKYKQNFLAGNVSYTKNENSQTWYSYDIYGRVTWIAQKVEGLGLKAIDYEYDPVTSQVTKVFYQKYNSGERFIHKYTYNTIGQLIAVATSENNSTFTPQATYEYYETGELKRTTLAGGLQAIDYIYNLNGALKMMNNPNNKKDATAKADDVFGMALHYYDGDYARKNTPITVPTHIGGTDQYTGNIKGIEWNNGFTEQKPVGYTYSYNKNNWLEGANFISNTQSGSTKSLSLDSEEDNNRSITSYHQVTLKPGFHVKASSGSSFRIKPLKASSQPDDYKVYGITYDANGNIQRLNRNKNTENGSNKMDQLTYHYYKDKKTGKPGNRLAYVSDAVTSNTNADDIKSQSADNYVYNEIGQLIENKQDGIRYSYTTSGLVDKIHKNGKVLVDFGYNDRGHRVYKKSYAKGSLVETTTYVRDASGSVMGIYTNKELQENPIYGSGRIGIHYRNKTDVYQIADHLGNVRSVIAKNGNNAVSLTAKTDYYPGGMAMPNRNVEGDYRYGYQGEYAETEQETGKVAFELRLYDPRINRWLSPDPYGQYHSPYISMGNNWVNSVDPDGGWETKWGQLWNWAKNGFSGKLYTSETAAGQGKYGISFDYGETGAFMAVSQGDITAFNSGFDGYVWNNEGTNAQFIGSISPTSEITNFQFWRDRPAEDFGGVAARVGVDLSYGTLENVYTMFSGSTFTGNVPQGNNAFEKKLDGFMTLTTLGYSKVASSLKSVKSTVPAWNAYQKSTKGLYSGIGLNANSIKSIFYKEGIKIHNNSVQNVQSSIDAFSGINTFLGLTEDFINALKED